MNRIGPGAWAGTAAARRPPGRSTRAISISAVSRSGTRCRHSEQDTASTTVSRNGNDIASARTKTVFVVGDGLRRAGEHGRGEVRAHDQPVRPHAVGEVAGERPGSAGQVEHRVALEEVELSRDVVEVAHEVTAGEPRDAAAEPVAAARSRS